MARHQIDWEAVAREYHSYDGPVTEIARKHGLAAISIYAKAKREGWARPAPNSGKTIKPGKPVRKNKSRVKRKPAALPEGDVNSSRVLARMMNIVNRLADGLEQHLDHPGAAVMSAVEKKGAADILTSLARALEKLTVLEREAFAHAGAGGAGDTQNGQNAPGPEESWDELQRRLARLAAGSTAQ